MHKIKKLFIVSMVFTSIVINAQVVTLDALIELAVENNSNVKVSKYKEDSQDASLSVAKAGYYPTLAFVGEVAEYDIDSGANQVDDTVKGVVLSANQLVYDFGRTNSSIDAAQNNLAASKEETIATISKAVLQTKQAYYNILRGQQRVSLYEEMIGIDQLHLEQIQAYHTAGIRTLIDVTDAKLQLSNSRLQLLESKYDLEEVQVNLNVVLGVSEQEVYEVKKDSHIIDIANSTDTTTKNLDSLKEQGLKNRPELRFYAKQIHAQEYQLEGVRDEYYPSLEIDATYSDKDSDKIASLNTKQMSAGMYLKWNLFTGNTTQASIKNNLAILSTLQQQLFQEKLEIKKSISIAYFKIKSSEESVKISSLAVELAWQKLDLANQRYKAGVSDSVELNEATLAYSEAKSTLINNYYNYLDSKAELDYTTGKSY